MKKTQKATILKTALLAIMIVVLLATFVACDPKPAGTDPHTKPNINTGDNKLSEVFPESKFNAFLSYVLSMHIDETVQADIYFEYYSQKAIEDKTWYGDSLIWRGISRGFLKSDCATVKYLCFPYDEYDPSLAIEVIEVLFLGSAEEASAMEEYVQTNGMGGELSEYENLVYHKIDNAIIIESEEGLYEDKVLTSTMPAEVSQARKQMLKQIYEKICTMYGGYGVYYGSNYESYSATGFNYQPFSGNCDEYLGWLNSEETIPYVVESWEEDKHYYTADSYCDTAKEPGYVFEYYKYKPGFVYEENDGYIQISDYYSENFEETLVVPATIDGKAVTKADLYNANQVKNLQLPDSVSAINIGSKSIETITMPTSVKSANITSTKLKTIIYKGSATQFKQTFSIETINSWRHVITGYDEEENQIWQDLTITVVCNDATLTYPAN